jgi:hypothetical protein
MNRLAGESFLLDHYYAESLDLERQWESFFSGRFPQPDPAVPKTSVEGETPFGRLRERGVRTLLLTDDVRLAERCPAEFDEIVRLRLPDAAAPAESFQETGFAVAMAQLYEMACELEEETLLWCHLRGFSRGWDFPMPYREMYVEEEDPSPFRGVAVPRMRMASDQDPDRLRSLQEAYAGGLTLLDEGISSLHSALVEGEFGPETLFLFGGTRGFPLGEQGVVIGTESEEGIPERGEWSEEELPEPLSMESVHLPMMIRFPDGAGEMRRSDLFIQPRDLLPTLLDWWNETSSEKAAEPLPISRGRSFLTEIMVPTGRPAEHFRDRLLVVSADGQRGVRTPGWWLHCPDRTDSTDFMGWRLYLKPDDYWEINDVSGRCPEVIEQFLPVLEELEQAVQSEKSIDLSPLPEVLLHGYQ